MTTTSVNIRPAGPADAADMARLSAELGYEADTSDMTDRLQIVCSLNGHEVLVAEHADGKLVGWIHIFAAPRIESAGFAEIGGLVVDANHRRRGVGAQLVAAAEEAAGRHGFGLVRVRSRIERGGAHDFYADRGFVTVKTQRVYEKLVSEKVDTDQKE